MRNGLMGNHVELLNSAVQTQIAKHLFLVCNYQPVPMAAPHASTRFLIRIQELYKVVADCGDLVRKMKKILPKHVLEKHKNLEAMLEEELEPKVKLVELLRFVVDHNNAEENGYEQQQQLQQYEIWVKKQISKPQPETEEDYEVLDSALEVLSDELCAVIHRVIVYIGEMQYADKSSIIRKWEWQILDWYARPFGNLYYGFLAMTYFSKARSRDGKFEFVDDAQRTVCVEEWVSRMLRHELQTKIDGTKAAIEVCGPIPVLLEQLETEQAELEGLEAEIQKEKGDRRYFLNRLPEWLRETMRECHCSMLPQELIDEDIKRRFESVPTADF